MSVTDITARRHGATALKRGERVAITVDGITAGGTYIASFKVRESNGQPGTRRLVELDGTGQVVEVPPAYIEREGI
jgi:hypothetical protein